MTAPAPAPVIPRMLVTGPPEPVAHRFGLFSAATVLEDVEPHALSGVEYETVCSTKVDPYPAACEPTVPAGVERAKLPADTVSVSSGTPFALYAADECVLGRDQATALAQLRQRFRAGEETAVERLVHNGALGNWPNLSGGSTTIAAGATVDLVDAVGVLEQWLALNYGGTGVIHAPMTVAGRARAAELVDVKGPRATTLLGSSWVFGAGYPGTGPEDLTDDGALWLYATPPVTVRRSTTVEPATWSTGGFDRATNAGFLLIERSYVLDWPCSSAAIKVTAPATRPGYVSGGTA